MGNLQAITQPEFTKKSWKGYPNYLFAAKDATCPLGLGELSRAAGTMPIALVTSDDGHSLVGVQGLKRGVNSYVVGDGKWRSSYVPAIYRAGPFALAKNSSKPEEQVLCFDTDSELLIHDCTGEPFFDQDSKPSQSTRKMLDFLTLNNASRQAGTHFCKVLSEHDLLKPWDIALEDANTQIGGLFCVDEAALNELSDKAYGELRQTGAIPFIYCQLISMQLISELILIAQERIESDPLKPSTELNFDGVSSDGNLCFDSL